MGAEDVVELSGNATGAEGNDIETFSRNFSELSKVANDIDAGDLKSGELKPGDITTHERIVSLFRLNNEPDQAIALIDRLITKRSDLRTQVKTLFQRTTPELRQQILAHAFKTEIARIAELKGILANISTFKDSDPHPDDERKITEYETEIKELKKKLGLDTEQ